MTIFKIQIKKIFCGNTKIYLLFSITFIYLQQEQAVRLLKHLPRRFKL